MKKRAYFLSLGAILFLLLPSEMEACGDKYLSVGRGSRFQRGYVSIRPVSIAVVRNGAAANKDFLSRLKLAGHRLEVVDDVAKLGVRLAASRFDVVLADYADAATVNRSIPQTANAPLFLPVVDATSPDAAAAHRQYGCLLSGNSKSKERSFLAVLDEAVASSRKGKPVHCELNKL